MKRKVAILGSTGSIGVQTLKSCDRLDLEVSALAANQSVEKLEKQAREYYPRHVVIFDKNAYKDLKVRLADTPINILSGMEGLCEVAGMEENDVVCNAVVGMVGLRPTLTALEAKKTVALANKETLVAAGELVMETAQINRVRILPVDSEHSAIFQCMQGNNRADLRKIILTASGGPFYQKTPSELDRVTLSDALKHPNWEMGAKITVDSSTMMNKGLEFIEAMHLFGLTPEQIEVVVHPQSVVHSAVEYKDGSVIAHLAAPDMAIPIQYALTWPRRSETDVKPLSLTEYGRLTFEQPDNRRFVCLRHCITAAQRGGLYPCAVNAANEYAVSQFIAGKIRWKEIGRCVGRVLEEFSFETSGKYTLEDVLGAQKQAQRFAAEYCRAVEE